MQCSKNPFSPPLRAACASTIVSQHQSRTTYSSKHNPLQRTASKTNEGTNQYDTSQKSHGSSPSTSDALILHQNLQFNLFRKTSRNSKKPKSVILEAGRKPLAWQGPGENAIPFFLQDLSRSLGMHMVGFVHPTPLFLPKGIYRNISSTFLRLHTTCQIDSCQKKRESSLLMHP